MGIPAKFANDCDIHEVRIDPCKEAANNKPCKVKQGKTSSMSFDFTPKFSTSAAQVQAYWTGIVADLPFPGMDTDACKYMTCPVAADQKTTLTYTLQVGRNDPAGIYDVKWKLWNEDNTKQCCFITKIKLTK